MFNVDFISNGILIWKLNNVIVERVFYFNSFQSMMLQVYYVLFWSMVQS